MLGHFNIHADSPSAILSTSQVLSLLIFHYQLFHLAQPHREMIKLFISLWPTSVLFLRLKNTDISLSACNFPSFYALAPKTIPFTHHNLQSFHSSLFSQAIILALTSFSFLPNLKPMVNELYSTLSSILKILCHLILLPLTHCQPNPRSLSLSTSFPTQVLLLNVVKTLRWLGSLEIDVTALQLLPH